MADLSQVKQHMEVIGADGVHVGTVDAVEGGRIKLTKQDSGSHRDHHHYLSGGLVATVEGNRVRLSANGDAAALLEEEAGGQPLGEARRWNWNRIGIGAAAAAGVAAAAAAGAALYRKRGQSEGDDFQQRLETDENVRLISSRKVEGTPVVARDGSSLGKIDSFMVDKYTGRVAYAVMSFGGVAGLGTSLYPVPWPLLDYDIDKDGYVLDVTKEQLAAAPKFEAQNTPEFNPVYRRELILFYRPA